MGIDEAGKHDFAGAVDLGDLLAMFFDPGIAESVFGGTDGDDLAAEAENGSVFNDAEFLQCGAAARALTLGGRAQGEKLGDVQQEQGIRSSPNRFAVGSQIQV